MRALLSFVLATAFAAPAVSAPLTIPFDFSKSEIGLELTVRGAPLYVLIDTGVDPSIIDLARADALGLHVDRGDAGEASGFGRGKGAAISPATIDGLAIGGRRFAPVTALASDLGPLSKHYGRRLDGVLGYSFLSDKIVLIDYPGRTLSLLDRMRQAEPRVQTCRTRWTTPFTTYDSFPIIPDFRLGAASGPVSLDTGSNGGIGLFGGALDLAGVRALLVERDAVTHSGARGDEKSRSYAFNAAVGFGPFTLPAGQIMTLHSEEGSADTRVANIGNAVFAEMKIKVLIDYRGKTMHFYGRCQ